jgi:hypothetical protein
LSAAAPALPKFRVPQTNSHPLVTMDCLEGQIPATPARCVHHARPARGRDEPLLTVCGNFQGRFGDAISSVAAFHVRQRAPAAGHVLYAGACFELNSPLTS